MKVLKFTPLVLLFLLFGCRVIYISRYLSNPEITKYSGEIRLKGIKNLVKVLRDQYGVPHIFADNETDLLMALGYVQAQDRLWQMELVRRIATGTLSEIVGEQEIDEVLRPARTTVEADILSRVLGFKFIGEEGEAKMIDRETRERLEAFCNGINAFIELHRDNLPLEFRILDFTPEKWRPAHVISVARFTSWGISDNWDVELLRYAIIKKVGLEKAWQILPKHKDPGPFIIPPDVQRFAPPQHEIKSPPPELPVRDSLNLESIELLRRFYTLSAISGMKFQSPGSNNWVVSGNRTASGKPILANDPHLPHMIPSVLYLAHLKTPDFNVYGAIFPGTPFVNIGFNDRVAWGATTTFADTQDIYIEKVAPDDPESYIYMGKKEKFLKRTERICVKRAFGIKCRDVEVLSTRHGPVLNSALPELKNSTYLFALRWTGYEKTGEDRAFLTLAKAKNIHDFKFAMKNMGALVQNWVYADVDGNIGFSVSGLVPIRKNHDGTLPVPGWTDEYEWDGFIPGDEMPQVFNPKRGYMITANNQVVPPDGYPYPFSYNYMTSDRAGRIEELIISKEKLTQKDMAGIQMDDFLVRGKRFVDYFVQAYKDSSKKDPVLEKMIRYLEEWDFHTGVESVATTIFEELMRQVEINTLKDELGEELFDFYKNCEITIASFNSILEDPASPLFDDINTPEIETRGEILLRSLDDAKRWLTRVLGSDPADWQWGKVHTLTFKHALGVVWPLTKWFNLGPFPHPGSRETVMAAFYFSGDEPYRTFVGPVFRFVIDMADPGNAWVVIDTGESGLPFSSHYNDLNPLWREGKYIKAIVDEKKLSLSMQNTLIVTPE